MLIHVHCLPSMCCKPITHGQNPLVFRFLCILGCCYGLRPVVGRLARGSREFNTTFPSPLRSSKAHHIVCFFCSMGRRVLSIAPALIVRFRRTLLRVFLSVVGTSSQKLSLLDWPKERFGVRSNFCIHFLLQAGYL